jgi:branched-chain amino acid aminotransferase
VNGERRSLEATHVSARDRGVTFADGVFETMRAHGRRVFRLDRHLERLEHAVAALEIPAPTRKLRDWVLAAVRDGDGADMSVRLTVTRGVGAGSLAPHPDQQPTVIVAVNPLPEFPVAIYEAGLSAHIASGRRNEHAMTAGLKTIGYTDAVAALLEAQRTGATEALFLDTEGHCSEATSSNLFIWTRGTLMTPPTSCGALPGITRAAVIELANALELPAAERVVGPDDLLGADEAFLTSSLRGLAPLVHVGAMPIGDGLPGPITKRLARAYSALVERECVDQQ